MKHFPDDPELRFRHATLLQHFGRPREAARVYEELLARVPASAGREGLGAPPEGGTPTNRRHLSSVDRGLAGYRARFNLAGLYAELGEPDKAEVLLREVIEEAPAFQPARRALDNLLSRAVTSAATPRLAEMFELSADPTELASVVRALT